jgi:ethanolamine kinase
MVFLHRHCTYCPAAFELANHFSEWAGFECDYKLLPTRSIRMEFILEYVRTQRKFLMEELRIDQKESEGAAATRLANEVDDYRGFPGFYW